MNQGVMLLYGRPKLPVNNGTIPDDDRYKVETPLRRVESPRVK